MPRGDGKQRLRYWRRCLVDRAFFLYFIFQVFPSDYKNPHAGPHVLGRDT